MRIAETFGRDDVWVDALRLEIRDDVVGATREQCDVIGDARPLPAGPTGLLSVWPYTTTFAFCRCCSSGTCGGHIVDLCRGGERWSVNYREAGYCGCCGHWTCRIAGSAVCLDRRPRSDHRDSKPKIPSVRFRST